MNHPGETQRPRRHFLVSGLSLFGAGLTMGSAVLLSGCGDEKSAGQLENVPDPTKTQSGMDSMNAYKSQHLNKSGKAKGK
jgi:hypothetical protein